MGQLLSFSLQSTVHVHNCHPTPLASLCHREASRGGVSGGGWLSCHQLSYNCLFPVSDHNFKSFAINAQLKNELNSRPKLKFSNVLGLTMASGIPVAVLNAGSSLSATSTAFRLKTCKGRNQSTVFYPARRMYDCMECKYVCYIQHACVHVLHIYV